MLFPCYDGAWRDRSECGGCGGRWPRERGYVELSVAGCREVWLILRVWQDAVGHSRLWCKVTSCRRTSCAEIKIPTGLRILKSLLHTGKAREFKGMIYPIKTWIFVFLIIAPVS